VKTGFLHSVAAATSNRLSLNEEKERSIVGAGNERGKIKKDRMEKYRNL